MLHIFLYLPTIKIEVERRYVKKRSFYVYRMIYARWDEL